MILAYALGTADLTSNAGWTFSAAGGVAFIVREYFKHVAAKEERSVAKSIGHTQLRTEDVIQILKEFKDDESRLKALEVLLRGQEAQARQLLDKLKSDINVDKLVSHHDGSTLKQLKTVGSAALLLGIITLVAGFSYGGGKANPPILPIANPPVTTTNLPPAPTNAPVKPTNSPPPISESLKRGIAAYSGLNGKIDELAAWKYINEADQDKNPIARAWLASLYKQGLCGSTLDRKKAEELAESCWPAVTARADGGDVDALVARGLIGCFKLSILATDNSTLHDLKSAADKDDSNAMWLLGRYLLKDKDTEVDGIRWLKEAEKHKNLRGKWEGLLREIKETERSGESIEDFRQRINDLAAAGCTEAMVYFAGSFYRELDPLPWLRLAAANGNVWAEAKLESLGQPKPPEPSVSDIAIRFITNGKSPKKPATGVEAWFEVNGKKFAEAPLLVKDASTFTLHLKPTQPCRRDDIVKGELGVKLKVPHGTDDRWKFEMNIALIYDNSKSEFFRIPGVNLSDNHSLTNFASTNTVDWPK
ncbi:MAG: hypothetical protein JWM68_355 [Verrucomicrobiales bacterium]|nr:hypothetical protein [Verrucomicrobiales bacterium]